MGNRESSTDYTHDLAVRLTASTQQTTGMDPRAFTYSHFAGDAGGEEVYPSGRRVVTCPDALQRVAWISGSKTYAECAAGAAASSVEAYASGILCWPHGSVKQMTLGNGVVETTEYDNRL